MRYLLCALWLSACGYTDEGDGSETLEVRAEVRYVLRDDTSELRVEVEKGNVVQSDATVELSPDEGGASFLVPFNTGPNRYQLDVTGYHRKLALSVKRPGGDDWLEAKLEGPGPHSVTAPANGERLSRPDELEVKWATEDGVKADEVTIEIRPQSGAEPPPDKPEDTGSHTIDNPPLDTGANVIRVTRGTDVNLAGATGLSFFKISYVVQNEIIVE